ncbi:MAG: hypothetical protein Q4A23_03275 [bacterium]|nr:hypothetical protein [bacterium]
MHLSSIGSIIEELEDRLWRLEEEYSDAVLGEALLCQALEEVELDETDINELLAHHEFIKKELHGIEAEVSYLNKKIANLYTKGEDKGSTSPKDNPLPTRKRRGRYMKPRLDINYRRLSTTAVL